MTRGVVIGDRRIKFRFFIFLAITLIIILSLAKLIIKRPTYGIIQQGKIISWVPSEGLVVRQEHVYTSPDYGKVDFFVSNGQEIDKDSLLAILFRENYDYKIMGDLYRVKQKISDYQNKNIIQEVKNKDFDKIQIDIRETLRIIQHNIQSTTMVNRRKQENQLRNLLNRRKKILDAQDPQNNYLGQLLEQEKNAEKMLNQWKVEIVSQESGLFSTNLDGLESLLTTSKLDDITLEQYHSLLGHTPPDSENGKGLADMPLYKIVAPDKWYIISLIPNKNILYDENDLVGVNLPGLSNDTLVGRIHKADYLSDSTFIILEMTENIESILDVRNMHMEIGTVTRGLMVPKNAIITGKNKKRLKILRNGKNHYVEIKVMAMDDEWAIIVKAKDTEILNPEDRVLIK